MQICFSVSQLSLGDPGHVANPTQGHIWMKNHTLIPTVNLESPIWNETEVTWENLHKHWKNMQNNPAYWFGALSFIENSMLFILVITVCFRISDTVESSLVDYQVIILLWYYLFEESM